MHTEKFMEDMRLKWAPKSRDLPGSSAVKNPTAMQETQVQSPGRDDSLEKGIATTPVFLPEKSRGQRSLMGYSL